MKIDISKEEWEEMMEESNRVDWEEDRRIEALKHYISCDRREDDIFSQYRRWKDLSDRLN